MTKQQKADRDELLKAIESALKSKNGVDVSWTGDWLYVFTRAGMFHVHLRHVR